jgi:hypothetical protein
MPSLVHRRIKKMETSFTGGLRRKVKTMGNFMNAFEALGEAQLLRREGNRQLESAPADRCSRAAATFCTGVG